MSSSHWPIYKQNLSPYLVSLVHLFSVMTFGQELDQPEQRVEAVASHPDVAHLARSLEQGHSKVKLSKHVTADSLGIECDGVCPFLELPEGGDGVVHQLPEAVTELHIVNLNSTL